MILSRTMENILQAGVFPKFHEKFNNYSPMRQKEWHIG